jgi:serine phosphatase RsbU (regulator of sigma subunit)
MTAMCVALDPVTGRASVVGAGHPPLLVTRRVGEAELVFSSAPPLGLLERSEFTATPIALAPEDGFLLYTDGLYGSSKSEGNRWTPEHLRVAISGGRDTAQNLLRRLLERVLPNEGALLPDDLAAVAVRRTK